MNVLWIYRWLTIVGRPLIEGLLRRRISQGKEDPARLLERRGIASFPRPSGELIWVHAASVGEAQSSLVLIEKILQNRRGCHVLQTTGTLTSATLMNERLPDGSFHQFAPIDRLPWVNRFLDHWQPDCALWMESELWPNLVIETSRRGIPSALVNARMSARTFRRWQRLSGSASQLLKSFSLCLAQTAEQGNHLRKLGAESVQCLGNLKFSADPLPADESELLNIREIVKHRPIWLAASTHPGEEEVVIEAHKILRTYYPEILTVIAPRHPARSDEIADLLKSANIEFSRRSLSEKPLCETYLADTLGELGLLYRLSRVAFIGGSMGMHGGHNPIEAASLNCAIIHGPDMGNFKSIADELHKADGAVVVVSSDSLAEAVGLLLKDNSALELAIAAASRVAAENTGAVDRIYNALASVMDGS
ncbi:MAG: 3-deoxy-D-manno-octulosonic acid transferase [Rickettsiales bacterium]|jgi:3-deoxy-D-manno-octulosonic-acid transferase|nr:3-deoxy-D-manno-octulosonic acid transferase [Rickettsiales bacterium]